MLRIVKPYHDCSFWFGPIIESESDLKNVATQTKQFSHLRTPRTPFSLLDSIS